ncbi:MAG TPA: hypothetical protein VJB57_19850 [Dehalococcoidia bacterium]|nr:hypothetical protein [Dehalococcoidia bacterium]
MSIPDAEKTLGFRPLEPNVVPDGYALYSRSIPKREIPADVLSRLSPAEAKAESQPAEIALEYRRNGSDFVPGILITETIDREGVGPVHLILAGPACGEEVTIGGQSAIYGLGNGSLYAGDNAREWLGCVETGPAKNIHVLLLTRGDVLIEIHAFPESGLTKDDVLRMAASLTEAK